MKQTWGFYQSKRNGCAPSRWHLTTLPCGLRVTSEPEETQIRNVGRNPDNRYRLGICSRCQQVSKEALH